MKNVHREQAFIIGLIWYAVCLSSISRAAKYCPDGYNQFGNTDSCYFISKSTKNWRTARSICKLSEADLLIIDSQPDMWVILEHLQNGEDYWIGLNDIKVEGDWRWIDGTKLSTDDFFNLNWKLGNPDNDIHTEHCVEYNYHVDRMLDKSCEKYYPYVCEKGSDATTCYYPWQSVSVDLPNSCYKLVRRPGTWKYAKEQCELDNANLLVISSEIELERIRNFLFEELDTSSIWLGVNYVNESTGNSSSWLWNDGSPLDTSILDWNDLEPNGLTSDEDCVVINSEGELDDIPCNIDSHKFICERSPSQEKIHCQWPPKMDMRNMDAKCHDPDANTILYCANLLDVGTMAEFRCNTNTYSSTGIPIAYSMCRSNGRWSNVGVFKCTSDNIEEYIPDSKEDSVEDSMEDSMEESMNERIKERVENTLRNLLEKYEIIEESDEDSMEDIIKD